MLLHKQYSKWTGHCNFPVQIKRYVGRLDNKECLKLVILGLLQMWGLRLQLS